MTAHRTMLAVIAAAVLAAAVAGCSSGAPAAASKPPAATSQAASQTPTSTAPTVFNESQIAKWLGLHRFPTGGAWLWVGPNGLHGELAILNSAEQVNSYAGDTYVVTNPAGTIGVKLLGGEANGNDASALAALKKELAGLPPK